MKKILATLALTGLAGAAFAQGNANWSAAAGNFIGQTNSSVYSTFSTANAGAATGFGGAAATPASSTTLFYYELLTSTTSSSAPTTVSGLGAWLDTGLEAQNGATANGRILQLNSGTAVAANNWPAGNTQNIIMVGWSANLGTTYSAALGVLTAGTWGANSFFGVGSSVGSLATTAVNPGVTLFGPGPGLINNGASSPMQMDLLFVGSVPEPGTMALAAVGGLSLLAFRRKK
jgi:hypothetical protein